MAVARDVLGRTKGMACTALVCLIVGCGDHPPPPPPPPPPRPEAGVLAVGETAKNHAKNRRGDVVFVHGLEGDELTTWESTKGDDATFWPAWLAKDHPEIGVWSVWYPAKISKWEGGSMAFQDRAKQLLNSLRLRGIGTTKPVVFVGHSLGGIVLKQMVRLSDDASRGGDTDRRWKTLATETRGIMFLATPHTGSDLGTYLENLALALGVTKVGRQGVLIQQLRSSAPELRELNEWYRQNVRRLHVAGRALYETQEFIPGHLVVSESAADPNIPGLSADGVDANHNTIAKPVSRDTDVYLALIEFVSQNLIPDDPWDITLDNFIDLFNRHRKDERIADFNQDYAGKRVRWEGVVRSVILPKDDPGWSPGYLIAPSMKTLSPDWVLAGFDPDTFRRSIKIGDKIKITGRIGRENSASGARLYECGWQDEAK